MKENRKPITCTDDLELEVIDLLNKRGIYFIHESQNNGSTLDFYIPSYDLYIEVKKFHTDRVINQLQSRENILLIQGKKSLNFLKTLF